RYIVIQSFATNLVSQDKNGRLDIFVHDRVTGSTECASVDSIGNEANDDCGGGRISADARFVAFSTWASNLVSGDTNNMSDVFVHDRTTGTTELVSVDRRGGPANGESFAPSLSADGRFVAFYSSSSDLVYGDSGFNYDIFLRDRQNGTTEMISVDSSGIQG